jgi:hypothetical protein
LEQSQKTALKTASDYQRFHQCAYRKMTMRKSQLAFSSSFGKIAYDIWRMSGSIVAINIASSVKTHTSFQFRYREHLAQRFSSQGK